MKTKSKEECNERLETSCCEPSQKSLLNILEISRRIGVSEGEVTELRIDAPSPDFPFESDGDEIILPDTEILSGPSLAKKTIPKSTKEGEKKHKTIHQKKQTFEYKNVLGWVLDSITLKPTIWSPDGCKITKAELYINSNLGIGAKWVRKKIKKSKFKKQSEKCNGKMECVILEYDLEWEVSIRVGWLRILTINSLTLNGFYQLCADGSFTKG